MGLQPCRAPACTEEGQDSAWSARALWPWQRLEAAAAECKHRRWQVGPYAQAGLGGPAACPCL